MDKTEIKKSLEGYLPRGYAKRIQAMVTNSTGDQVSLSLISKVCNPGTKNWNDAIISQALIIAKEEKDKFEGMKLQAAAL